MAQRILDPLGELETLSKPTERQQSREIHHPTVYKRSRADRRMIAT